MAVASLIVPQPRRSGSLGESFAAGCVLVKFPATVPVAASPSRDRRQVCGQSASSRSCCRSLVPEV